ncbi:MAG: hypothetical protein JW795_09680 [Chitinivibrionales bacterium]|nr:hypothetical protein [Chitinivibrionales bacterium]
MNYTISQEKRNSVEFLTLYNNITNEFVECIPSLGAMIHRLCLRMAADVQSIIMPADESQLALDPLFRGRILFPFNDMIPAGQYTFDGVDYTLPLNLPKENKAIHGMVYNKPFSIIWQECSRTFCKVILEKKILADEFEGYPFACSITLSYILRAREFQMNVTVKNNHPKPIPFSFGWHPYFTIDDSIDMLTLHMDCQRYIEVDARLQPTQAMIGCRGSAYDFTQGKQIGDSVFDIGLMAPTDGKITLSGKNGSIRINQDVNFFHYVQIFTPPDRRCIAIEPVTAATNAFNFPKLGLNILAPDTERVGFVVIKTLDTTENHP